MGSVFAVQVRTGYETKTKELLKYALKRANDVMIKGVYALETYTEFIKKDTESFSSGHVNSEDLDSHLKKEHYSTSINNQRLQLEAIERYNSPDYEKIKQDYRNDINQLQREATKIRKKSKTLHSVLRGYILIELEQNSRYLPNHLWQLVNDVPTVHRILSTDPIPEEEIDFFFDRLVETMKPEVEIEFGKELNYEEVHEYQSEMLKKVNKKGTSREEQVELLDKIDEFKLSVVQKTREFLENKPVNPFFSKIKAFFKRKKEVVIMPLHYLEILYTPEELNFIGQTIKSKDFLQRLNYLDNKRESFQ